MRGDEYVTTITEILARDARLREAFSCVLSMLRDERLIVFCGSIDYAQAVHHEVRMLKKTVVRMQSAMDQQAKDGLRTQSKMDQLTKDTRELKKSMGQMMRMMLQEFRREGGKRSREDEDEDEEGGGKDVRDASPQRPKIG